MEAKLKHLHFTKSQRPDKNKQTNKAYFSFVLIILPPLFQIELAFVQNVFLQIPMQYVKHGNEEYKVAHGCC